MHPEHDSILDTCLRICPYCGYKYQVETEDISQIRRIEECEECGKKFYSYDEIEFTHYATPDCELNGEKHKWIQSSKYNWYWECKICGKGIIEKP